MVRNNREDSKILALATQLGQFMLYRALLENSIYYQARGYQLPIKIFSNHDKLLVISAIERRVAVAFHYK